MKCTKGYELKVLRSPAGYYIGTMNDENEPMCRLSQDYYKKEDDAIHALETSSFRSREEYNAMEIMFCNEGCGCFKHKSERETLYEIFERINREAEDYIDAPANMGDEEPYEDDEFEEICVNILNSLKEDVDDDYMDYEVYGKLKIMCGFMINCMGCPFENHIGCDKYIKNNIKVATNMVNEWYDMQVKKGIFER